MVGRRAPEDPATGASSETSAASDHSGVDQMLQPYGAQGEADARTTEMHAAELAALAEYDDSRSADTAVSSPPDRTHTEVRPPAPTVPWGAEIAPRPERQADPPRASEGLDASARRVTIATSALSLVVGLTAGAMLPRPEAAAPARSATPIATPSAAADADPLASARVGEMNALEALAKKSMVERSTEETLALTEGRSRVKRHALEVLAAELEETPVTRARQLRLMDFIQDRETTLDAARVAAKLDGPHGPDVLYAIWVGTRERDETTMLAQELVYSVGVRSKASDALSVALDLRRAESCEDYLSLLPRAVEHGDRRSVHLLGELTRTVGCGPKGADDCFACLRSLDRAPDAYGLRDALRAVALRPAPEL